MARFDYIIIGFLVFTAVIIAGLAMVSDLDDSYSDVGVNMSGVNDSFGGVYDTMDDVYNLGQDVKNKTIDEDISKDESDSGAISSMTRGAYGAIRLVPRTFSLFRNIINAIAGTMGLSCDSGQYESKACVFIDMAFIAFLITIVFSLVYMIFRFIPR